MNNNEINSPSANILIVDDIPANLKILCAILESEGYKVRPVPSGKLALQVAENEKPDLILLDIMMPEMDGFEVCQKLKDNDNLKDVPIIFISALKETSDIVKALAVGGVDYITKPFQSAEVKARVDTHIKLRQQNQLLQNQSKELEKLNANKDQFISILAHDLRSPFQSLLGVSDLVLENIRVFDLDHIEEFILLMNKSAKNTYNLLEDLLMWAKSQSGKLTFDPQSYNFLQVCEDVVGVLKINAKQKNITIKHFAPQEIDIFVDLDMFKTILRNLISNAIKFTNNGGMINIYAQQNQSEVTITVSDNGVGIAPEIHAKLFDLYKNRTTLGTAKETGTGLGLSLCKDFVEKHKGKIWIKSEEGKGSDFKFTLPNKA